MNTLQRAQKRKGRRTNRKNKGKRKGGQNNALNGHTRRKKRRMIEYTGKGETRRKRAITGLNAQTRI